MLDVLRVVDYWGCTAVLPAIDSFLAALLLAGRMSVSDDNLLKVNKAELKRYLELASQHKLRRYDQVPMTPSLDLQSMRARVYALRRLGSCSCCLPCRLLATCLPLV